MKKLLQINSVINSGSTGRIAEEIGLTAIEAGWESYIAYGRKDRPSKSAKIKIGNDIDLKWHGLQTRFFDKHGFGSKHATNVLVNNISQIKPDIIHLHNIHGYYINIEILFEYLETANIPVVWTLHDCWSITGHCAHFTSVGCDKWKTECYRCPQRNEYPASILVDRSKENFKIKKKLFSAIPNLTLVPVSNWLASIIKQSFLQNASLKVIHNGINTKIFTPTSSSFFREKYHLEEKFILLGVTNIWVQKKGLFDFIELSKRLNEDFQIVLVGLTNKQIKQLPTNIIGIERTESVMDLADIYSTCDVFLNLTYEDNFPTTNLESLACGTPVITYKTGGSPESIDDLTGIIVEKGDIESLLIAVDKIKVNGKQFYSNACRNRAINLYSKEDRYQEYIELYDKLLKSE